MLKIDLRNRLKNASYLCFYNANILIMGVVLHSNFPFLCVKLSAMGQLVHNGLFPWYLSKTMGLPPAPGSFAKKVIDPSG